MPRGGFKSLTVRKSLYDRYYAQWLKVKDEMNMIGVSSFSGYITYIMQEILKEDRIFSKYPQIYKKLSMEKGRILIKDNRVGRLAEITFVNGNWYCHLCSKESCSHIGFCYSDHEFYSLA